jgi:hypothetical protein
LVSFCKKCAAARSPDGAPAKSGDDDPSRAAASRISLPLHAGYRRAASVVSYSIVKQPVALGRRDRATLLIHIVKPVLDQQLFFLW